MFLNVSNIKSSSVESLAINAGKQQAIVKYVGNDKSYLYNDVDFAALYNLVYNQVESVGRWVNTNCKQDAGVQCLAV